MQAWRKLLFALGVIVASHVVAMCGTSAQGPSDTIGSSSGLPVPRFVSLKSEKVDMYVGPAKSFEIKWRYQRAGLPVEITGEYENWRRIRDSEGAEGWVYHSLLSGRRTAVVMLRSKTELIALRAKPDSASPVTAQLQAGVLGSVKRCAGGWCRLVGQGYDGWVPQEKLWGVYPNEPVE